MAIPTKVGAKDNPEQLIFASTDGAGVIRRAEWNGLFTGAALFPAGWRI
jgi:hypothetical protein